MTLTEHASPVECPVDSQPEDLETDSARAPRSRRLSGGNRSEKVTTRDVLLRAAELVFAEYGYKGATVRHITKEANVTVGMMRYYFGSKTEMLQEVIGARSGQLCARLKESLRTIRPELSSEKTRLRSVVRAYIEPHFHLISQDDGWRYYFRVVYQLPALEERDLLAKLLIPLHAEVALEYRETLKAILGGACHVEPAWRLLLMVLSSALVEVHAPERTGEAVKVDDMVSFCAAGIAALGDAAHAEHGRHEPKLEKDL